MDEKDPKTWTFELSIKQQINKRIWRVWRVIIVVLLLLNLSAVGMLWLTKSLGSGEEASGIFFRVVFAILLSVLFIGWIIGKKVRKKYWPIIVIPIIALTIVILFVNNYPSGEAIERNDIFSFAGDYLSFLGAFCLGYFIFLQDEAKKLRIDGQR